ncbi:MAG: CYCXC family (seleno)protein [Deltaproteobacteria bacterium]
MKTLSRIVVLMLMAVTFLAVGSPRGDQSSSQDSKGRQSEKSEPPVPPYYKSAKEAEPLPATLPPVQFAGRPVVVTAYTIAKKIPLVLAQQPCYCGCDREFGHHSLLDCYTSSHTAGCAVCVKETFLTYEMTQQHKTPAEIRAAIIHGDWKSVDLNRPPKVKP